MEERQIAYTDEITVMYEETVENLRIKNHYHNTYELIYIIEGIASIEINSRKYEAFPGSLIFINHLESHGVEVLQVPYNRYYLLIKPQFFQKIIDDRRLISIFTHRPEDFLHIIRLNENEKESVTSLFMQIKEELDSKLELRHSGAAALMQLLFIHLYRNHRPNFPFTELSGPMNIIRQVQEYIDEHYLEPVKLKEVSDMFFMDMCYISRLFKKISGFSFKEYLILQRLSAAKDLLVNGNMSITQVCINSGFCNVNHFIRTFKQNEGISPYQYRKKYQKTLEILPG